VKQAEHLGIRKGTPEFETKTKTKILEICTEA
jgi:hypothetical protein